MLLRWEKLHDNGKMQNRQPKTSEQLDGIANKLTEIAFLPHDELFLLTLKIDSNDPEKGPKKGFSDGS